VADELTVVLFALDREAKPFARRCRIEASSATLVRRWCPEEPADSRRAARLSIVVTGIGTDASDRAMDRVLSRQPARIISAGYCGSLVREHRVGDVILPNRVVDAHGEMWPLQGATADLLLSVDQPVLTLAERVALHQRSGAVIVDQETATIARRCQQANIPCNSVRVVTDDLDNPLPHDLLTAVEGERLRLSRLCWNVCRRPTLVRDLWRLARHTRRGSLHLADALDRLLASLETNHAFFNR
jgi:nucleoside phosphorylase